MTSHDQHQHSCGEIKALKITGQGIYDRNLSLPALFAFVVAENLNATAVREGARSLTYGELEQRSNQVARRLLAHGVQHGDRVFMLCGRGIETLLAMLAVLKCGGAFAPADPAYPPEQIALMLEDCAPKLTLLGEGFAAMQGQLASVSGVMTSLSSLIEEAGNESVAPLPDANRATDLAYVMFTSGSTGRPKGVAVRHRGIARLVRAQNYASFGPDDIVLHMASLAFDASTFEIWGALLNGSTLVILPQARPSLAEIGAAIIEHRVTTALITTGLFHAMVDCRLHDLKRLRQLIAGGDILSPTHVGKVLRELPDTQLINAYGPTETPL